MAPQVSVIIPTYNRASCLPDAISTVQQQKDVTCEIIVVDDGSTDTTPQLIADLQKTNPNLVYLRHGENKGVSAARNTGIRQAQGTYIAFLDSDDLWMPEKLAKQLDHLAKSGLATDETFCASYYSMRDRAGNTKVDPSFLPVNGKPSAFTHYFTGESLERVIVAGRPWFAFGSSLVAHRDAIAKNGFFHEEIGMGEDYEYVVRQIMAKRRVIVTPEPLISYLVPESKKTYSRSDPYPAFMANSYKCAIAERWGETEANLFIKALMFNYAVLNESPKKSWTRAEKEFRVKIESIPVAAPCVRPDKPFDCVLKGGMCRLPKAAL